MMSLQEFFLSKDERIKEIVEDFSKRIGVQAEFKGYYIEHFTGSYHGSAKPIFEDYSDYRKNEPYSEITHVRYFFDLSKEEEVHTLTIHLGLGDQYEVGFSIEELGGGVGFGYPETELKYSDFRMLMSFMQSKFESSK